MRIGRSTALVAVGLALVFLFRDALSYATIDYTVTGAGTDVLTTVARLAALVLLSGEVRSPRESALLQYPRLLAATSVATLGMGSIALAEFGLTAASDVAAIGRALTGVGNVLLLIAFAEFTFRASGTAAIPVFLMASYLYGCARVLLSLLSPEASLLLLTGCPTMACAFLFEAARVEAREGTAAAEPSPVAEAVPAATAVPARGKHGFRPPMGDVLLLAGLFVYAFLYCVLQARWTGLVGETEFPASGAQAASGLGVVCGTLLVQAICHFFPKETGSPSSAVLPLFFMSVLYMSTFLTDILVPVFVALLYTVQRLAFFLMWEYALEARGARGRLRLFCLAQLVTEGSMLVYYVASALFQGSGGFILVATCTATVILIAVEVVRKLSSFWSSRAAQPVPDAVGHVCPAFSSSMLPSEQVLCAFAEKYGLTQRERELLPYIQMGRTPEYIGNALVIAPTTAKTHIRNIYRKTGVSRRGQLVVMMDAWRKESAGE